MRVGREKLAEAEDLRRRGRREEVMRVERRAEV
jgi:hypothetical protein